MISISHLLLYTTALTLAVDAAIDAYPCPVGTNVAACNPFSTDDLIPIRKEIYGNGRIIDISHRLHPDMPSWDSEDGLGQFLSLPGSMKNGSIANSSEMKLPAHTGTHVDAPGHVYDHYFDAGFDVDTLDLDVLNALPFSLSTGAYPFDYGENSCSCGGKNGDLVPERREIYDNGRIYDITHKFTRNTPGGDPVEGVGEFLSLSLSMKNGSLYNFSVMKLPVHAGTHVDAPGHMYDQYFDAGFDIDSLDLEVLNGPALLVDVPREHNITAEVMKSLNIPKGVRRVLFRTLNTDRRLMFKKAFDTSYVGFMKDGAQWMVDNTDIKLVGIDYLSVAAYDHLIPSHLVLLKNREIILVEGLKLDDVKAGIYNVHCLPLRLLGAEGSPMRCILMK